MKKFLHLFFICLLSCGNPRGLVVPENEKEIIEAIISGHESISAYVRKGREGAYLIRIMMTTSKADEHIVRINKKYSLACYHSSRLTADNLATSHTKGAMIIPAEDWMPEEYYLVAGYTGDGVSLARYDFKDQNRTILILYARSEELLHVK